MKNLLSRCPITASVAVAAGLIGSSQATAASTYTWTGGAGTSSWLASGNWSPAGGPPIAGDSAILDTAAANRSVTFDSSITSLNSLTINQTNGAFSNVFDLQKRALTITNAVILGSATGTAKIFFDVAPVGTVSGTLTIPQLTLNTGGVLEFSNAGKDASNYNQDSFTGNLVINGGTLQLDQGVGPVNTSTYPTVVTGSLTMASGTINMGVAAPNPSGYAYAYWKQASSPGVLSNADRLTFTQSTSISGGTLVIGGTVSNGVGTYNLYLNGATNDIYNLSVNTLQKDPISNTASSNYNTNDITALVRMGLSDATLTTDSKLAGGLYIVNSGAAATYTVSVGSHSGAALTVGQLGIGAKNANSTEVMKLTSDISSPYIIGNAGQSVGAGSIYRIDTNGHTLDVSAAASSTGFEILSSPTANLSLTNSSTTAAGSIKAKFFNLAYHTGGSSVGPNVNLIATGTGGLTSNLGLGAGGSGAIDPTSTFTYNGTATTANYDKLSSSRNIGNLTVQSHALQLASAITTDSTSTTTVGSGATLNLGGFVLSTGGLSVDGTLNGAGSITASGLFSGSGSIGATGGSITSNGTFAPGAIGTVGGLTISTGLLALGGTSAFDVASASSFDKALNAAGVTYGGALSLNFLGTFTPTLNETFALFNGSGSSGGSFSSITSNLDGYAFSFAPTTGLLTVTAVPEPMLLAWTGISTVILLRRRQHRL